MTKNNATDGDYIVRLREAGSAEYILVLIFKSKPTHHLMKLEGGSWTINKKVYVPDEANLVQVGHRRTRGGTASTPDSLRLSICRSPPCPGH